MTDGKRTVDVIWLTHTGTDIYYNFIGWPGKTSYHASGQRHHKAPGQPDSPIQAHHPLTAFRGQLQLCVFCLDTIMVRDGKGLDYKGKEADAVLWLDTRTLPRQVGLSLGLLEVGAYGAMLPPWPSEHVELRSVHLITNTVPWIYLKVEAIVNPSIGPR